MTPYGCKWPSKKLRGPHIFILYVTDGPGTVFQLSTVTLDLNIITTLVSHDDFSCEEDLTRLLKMKYLPIDKKTLLKSIISKLDKPDYTFNT